jgi:hypothetical protein
MVVRKVVELSATRPTQSCSIESAFRCDGESLAELLDDAEVRGGVGGRRRKPPPGMARRSSRHWARPEPERTVLELQEPEASTVPTSPPRGVASVEQPWEREREPEPTPEPPSIEVDVEQLLSAEDEAEDPEMFVASALISAASEGNAAEVTRLLEAANVNTALQAREEIEDSWHGATALIAAAVRTFSTSVAPPRVLLDLLPRNLISYTCLLRLCSGLAIQQSCHCFSRRAQTGSTQTAVVERRSIGQRRTMAVAIAPRMLRWYSGPGWQVWSYVTRWHGTPPRIPRLLPLVQQLWLQALMPMPDIRSAIRRRKAL